MATPLESKPQQPTSPTDGAPLTVTSKAVTMIKLTREQEGLAEGCGLRVAVRGGGCSGFEYALDFEEEARETDFVLELDGLQVYVDPGSEAIRSGQDVECLVQHPILHGSVVGQSEWVSEGELHSDRSRRKESRGEVRHHGDDHRWNPGCFDPACQHGHVLAAVRSDGRKDESVDLISMEQFDDGGGGEFTPSLQARPLKPHHRDVLGSNSTDYSARSSLRQPVDRQRDVRVGQDVVVTDMQVGQADSLHRRGNGSKRWVAPGGLSALAVQIERFVAVFEEHAR